MTPGFRRGQLTGATLEVMAARQRGGLGMASDLALILIAFGCLFAGIGLERWRARMARAEWQRRNRTRTLPTRQSPALSPWGQSVERRPDLSKPLDPAEQLRLVSEASFEPRRLLSHTEARVLTAAETAIAAAKLPWRVMAQVSLGEVLASPEPRAFRAVNAKRVDLLLVKEDWMPLAAVEYQGQGHYQGTAPTRDAIKKEALRKAGVRYVEVTTEHGPEDLAAEILRIARVEETKPQRDARL
jgi:hypothetical protein